MAPTGPPGPPRHTIYPNTVDFLKELFQEVMHVQSDAVPTPTRKHLVPDSCRITTLFHYQLVSFSCTSFCKGRIKVEKVLFLNSLVKKQDSSD